jgi:hypothetical protein
MLMVLAMKIAIAGACARHDLSAVSGASTTQQTSTVQAIVADEDGSRDLSNGFFDHSAGSCSHCSFHDAAAVLPEPHYAIAASTHQPAVRTSGLPPSAIHRLELRPPIV